MNLHAATGDGGNIRAGDASEWAPALAPGMAPASRGGNREGPACSTEEAVLVTSAAADRP
jgi:hypothetical protein